ncbi:nuclear transport factor 2 family protein [Sorangium sp. So ce302]|uniref:nuclear transport factor 2 family protein n=1 Tax=Sorangium sp. So ce302 TaxID=3133297 RepID=UPI003F61638A
MPKVGTSEIYRIVRNAFAKGDIDTLNEYIHPDVVWHFPGKGPLAGDIQGRDAALAFMSEVLEKMGEAFRVEPIAVAASGNYGFSWQRVTAGRDKAKLDMIEAVVFKVRDGKIVEVWHRPEQDKIEAFLS